MIHVCSLARLAETVRSVGARHVITLLPPDHAFARPAGIVRRNHLFLGMDDIVSPLDGRTIPTGRHVARLLGFVRRWDRASPLVIHCHAGKSRSAAAAYIAACALDPSRDEEAIANGLRAASPTAWPNRLLVTLADRRLRRDGRMIRAIETIGPGIIEPEAEPFRLDLA